MKLKKILEHLPIKIKGDKERQITGISNDSRTLAPGHLFIAKKGKLSDGSQFISQAVHAGAAAILTDLYDPFVDLPQLLHPNPASLEAQIASLYYGHPSKELFVVGVTGTKGKTTTTYLIHHLLQGLSIPSGLMSTVETILPEKKFSSTLTTHDAIFNQRLLKEMLKEGCKGAVLEVSSHGLDQARVEGIEFDVGVFTNLYPDHLDYHKTMEEYANAKRQLFERADRAILNADSSWAEKMGKGLSYGIEKGEIRAENIQISGKGIEFTIEKEPFFSPLLGRFNIYNLLAAICVGLDRGASLSTISSLLPSFSSVPGRLERVGNVFIDYAHTKEALFHALETLRQIAPRKLLLVFGCGGNRDPGRRKGMAEAAEALADEVIITTDNPRHEDPKAIAEEIASHFCKRPRIELDRKKAISLAIEMTEREDLLLIAGKGHEKMQVFANQTLPFDDVEVVRELLANDQRKN